MTMVLQGFQLSLCVLQSNVLHCAAQSHIRHTHTLSHININHDRSKSPNLRTVPLCLTVHTSLRTSTTQIASSQYSSALSQIIRGVVQGEAHRRPQKLFSIPP